MKLPAPWAILFGSQPLELALPGSTPDAVARLRGVVYPTFLPLVSAPSLVGTVSEEGVTVRLQRRWYPNSNAPVFVGRFDVAAGRQSLAGIVRLSKPTQVWYGAAVGFLLLCSLTVSVALALGLAEPGAEWGLLVLLFLWTALLGELYFIWWRGRRDGVEIEKRLRDALSAVAA